MVRHGGLELLNPFKILERAGLQRGWNVADLGCGSLGHFVFPAAQMVGGDGRVYAVDIQKQVIHAIERAAKHDQFWNIIPVWSDIEVLHAARIPSASLDLTLIINNLYLAQNREGLIQEAIRLTKAEGRLLFIEWTPGKTLLGPPDHHRLSIEDARALLRDESLQEEELFEAGEFHYGLLYRRHVLHPEAEVMHISHPIHR